MMPLPIMLAVGLAAPAAMPAPQGTNVWYFAATSYTATGLESVPSSELVWSDVWTNAPDSGVTLVWNPSASQGVAGYRVYYGRQSHNYTNMVDTGNVTNTAVQLIKPPPPVTNGFTVFLQSAPSINGPWASNSAWTGLRITNGPSGQPSQFYRAAIQKWSL